MNTAADQHAAHRVHPSDHVAVALADIPAGALISIDGQDVRTLANIPKGHKLALQARQAGDPVIKYGWPIGRATGPIAPGEHVHSHNLSTGLAGLDEYVYRPAQAVLPFPENRTFQGYRRRSGAVGTRNEIWILCTVGCVARTAQRIAAEAARRLGDRVDGVHALTHPFGCSQLGDDLKNTRRILSGLAGHPNAGGVLIVGLGCENNQLDQLLAEATHLDRNRVRSFNAQFADDELEEGLRLVEDLAQIVEQDRREPAPLSELRLGVKCGGSDGFSGLTANPLVGCVTDIVAAAGGTPIVTEIPEIFGAEQALMDRAVSQTVFDEAASVVNDFKQYFLDHGQPVYENPSPGNIAGGITTLEEKSLGAVQKAGHAPLTQVLRYGEQAAERGLALLEAPGNDAVSSTALTAAGATVILFTTGRGTPLGFPAPTLKIASNSALAERKRSWIDFDAGTVIEDGLERATEDLLQLVIETASGRLTRAERNDEREIAIWKGGVTL